MSVSVGCNSGVFTDFQSAVPGAVVCRAYRDTINDIPVKWPGVTGSTKTIVSLKPDPIDLLNDNTVPDNGSGYTTLAGQITYLISQAPNGAILNTWHEAGNLYGGWPNITATNIRQVHVKMQNLCNAQVGASNQHVSYGCIIYGKISVMADWIPSSTYPLDWYGIDVYDNDNSNDGGSFRNADGTVSQAKINAYMNEYQTLAQQRSPKVNPRIHIAECNSPVLVNRGPLFTYLAEWLSSNNGYRLSTFYKCGGNSGGCWDATDQPTIEALNDIVATFG